MNTLSLILDDHSTHSDNRGSTSANCRWNTKGMKPRAESVISAFVALPLGATIWWGLSRLSNCVINAQPMCFRQCREILGHAHFECRWMSDVVHTMPQIVGMARSGNQFTAVGVTDAFETQAEAWKPGLHDGTGPKWTRYDWVVMMLMSIWCLCELHGAMWPQFFASESHGSAVPLGVATCWAVQPNHWVPDPMQGTRGGDEISCTVLHWVILWASCIALGKVGDWTW